MSDLEDELARLNYDLEEEPVSVIALHSRTDLRFDGININLVNESETEVPLWIAEILREKGLVRIKDEKKQLHQELQKIARDERRLGDLTELDSLLYRKVKLDIEKLREKGTTMSLKKLTSIEGSINSILRLRARKILSIVRDDEKTPTQLSRMTAEEKWLFQNLNDVYRSWKEKIGESTFEV